MEPKFEASLAEALNLTENGAQRQGNQSETTQLLCGKTEI